MRVRREPGRYSAAAALFAWGLAALTSSFVHALRPSPSMASQAESPPPPEAKGMALLFEDDFESGSLERWELKTPGLWRVVEAGEGKALELTQAGAQGEIRAPSEYAVVRDVEATDFVLTARVQCRRPVEVRGRDMVVLFGYQGPTRFYYAHFSNYTDSIHNAIHIVNDAPRSPIDGQEEAPARLDDLEYHLIKIVRDSATGEIRAFIDDMATPILTAVDRTFASGRVGFGAFDDFGRIDDVRLWGRRPETVASPGQ